MRFRSISAVIAARPQPIDNPFKRRKVVTEELSNDFSAIWFQVMKSETKILRKLRCPHLRDDAADFLKCHSQKLQQHCHKSLFLFHR